MAYIGQNADGNFTTSVSKDTFSGNDSTTAFTLSEGATTNTVDVFVENIRQEPTTAYSVDGTTLTFTAAPVTGTNNIYVVNRGPIQLSASHPAAQALTAHSATITTDLTVDTNTLFVDSTNNRVGVGTVSPSQVLTVKTATDVNFIALNDSGVRLQATNDAGTSLDTMKVAGNPLIFLGSGGAETARIDSSGDIMAGTTSEVQGDSSGTGLYYDVSKGALQLKASGNVPIVANRVASDGVIAQFRKDGTSVGSIGVTGGDILYLTCESHGIKINSDAARIDPSDGSGNSSDNALDLGDSGARFKDLYLGGNLYLGGTGSANALDDYEEGTWTPAITQGWTSVSYTNSFQYGNYTKVGNMVTAWFFLRFSGTSAGNQVFVGGLPFTTPSSDNQAAHRGGAVTYFNVPVNSAGAITAYVAGGNTVIQFYAYDDGGAGALSNANASDDFLIGSVTYWVA